MITKPQTLLSKDSSSMFWKHCKQCMKIGQERAIINQKN